MELLPLAALQGLMEVGAGKTPANLRDHVCVCV